MSDCLRLRDVVLYTVVCIVSMALKIDVSWVALFYSAQVLSNKEKVFLRIANDRGWTYARNPSDDSVLFEEIGGEVADDT